MSTILITFSLMNNMIFMLSSHPLSSTLSILLQTILVCLIIGYNLKSMWFSYILFLIFLGGMMVLFIYMTSLSSNELFQMNMSPIMITALMFLLFFLFMNYIECVFILPSPIESNYNPSSFFSHSSKTQNKLFNNPNFLITLMNIIYLLFVMITTTKISSINQGTIRSSN